MDAQSLPEVRLQTKVLYWENFWFVRQFQDLTASIDGEDGNPLMIGGCDSFATGAAISYVCQVERKHVG